MKLFRTSLLGFAFCWLTTASVLADIYYVATNGSNANPGSEAEPWLTVQYAASNVVAGDTVLVQPGNYDEQVTTVQGGTGESNRIIFQGNGSAVLHSFVVQHPYVTVDGFQFTRHSGATVYDGYVQVGPGGDYFHLLNNTIRDGIYIVRTNIVFHDNGTNLHTITCESGGFIEAGFETGQTIQIVKGSSTPILNSGAEIVEDVTDNTLTVQGTFSDEGPVPAYITGSYVYGLVIGSGAQNCVIRANVFTNLSYDGWFVGGETNLFENNILTYLHGWDNVHFMGTDQIFRGNLIWDSPLVVYQTTPDAFENFGLVDYHRVLFVGNFVGKFAGTLGIQHGPTTTSDRLYVANNVFMDASRFSIRFPNTTFENNTFLNAPSQPNAVTAEAAHSITFAALNTENAVVRNNVFVGCGSRQKLSPDLQGWYEFLGDTETATLSHNFVAGASPDFLSKPGFDEGIPALNGGDPGFVNIDDPLGPDGLPFTADDGLRLRPDSKLRGAGVGGVDLGAYNTAVALTVVRQPDGWIRISWPALFEGFELQSAPSVVGPWTKVSEPTIMNWDENVVTLEATNNHACFRLFKPELALALALESDSTLRITWPTSFAGFSLQVAPEASGPWTDLSEPVVVEGDINVVTLGATNEHEFYRLAK